MANSNPNVKLSAHWGQTETKQFSFSFILMCRQFQGTVLNTEYNMYMQCLQLNISYWKKTITESAQVPAVFKSAGYWFLDTPVCVTCVNITWQQLLLSLATKLGNQTTQITIYVGGINWSPPKCYILQTRYGGENVPKVILCEKMNTFAQHRI